MIAIAKLLRRYDAVYDGYEEALRHCKSGGYDSADIAAVVRAKTQRMLHGNRACEEYVPPAARASLAMAVVAAQSCSDGAALRVLDFGGACGAHYFAVRGMAPQLRLQWCVVETAIMMESAGALESDSLHFAPSIARAVETLGGVDLLYSSGTLQYLPDPLGGLSALLRVGAPAMALTRLSLTDGAAFTTLQRSRLSHNGPGPMPHGFADRVVSYPVSFVNRTAFQQVLQARYSIAAHWRDESSDHETPRGPIRGSSCLCLRNEDARR